MSGYEMGVVYIWQNQVGEYAHNNGVECMVTGPLQLFYIKGITPAFGWPTDTPTGNRFIAFAHEGDLRRKRPPAGEESILRMFTAPAPRELEPA